VVPYSIQWLKRLRPPLFRQDLIALLDLLKRQKIKPLIGYRFPLVEARDAHELLGKEGVTARSSSCATGHRLNQARRNNGMQRTALSRAA
jgi:Zinc-binding dehydrogenase